MRAEEVTDAMLAVLASGFADQVAAWTAFYALAGGAAATLLGLVFVAMSLHADPSGRNLAVERELWTLAAGVLAVFADVVLSALAFLVPGQTTLGVGLPIVVLGALALLINIVVTRRVRRAAISRRRLLAAPLLSCLLQVVAGAGITVGEPVWLDVLAVATGLLLLAATLASWLLLSGPALAALRRSVAQASPPDS